MNVSRLANSVLDSTQTAIDVFLGSKNKGGLIDGITYWQVANGYTAIALHDVWSDTTTYSGILDKLLGQVEANQTDFSNDFNDDTMWWAMCSLELFDLNHEVKHLSVAEAICKYVSHYVIPEGKYTINGVDMKGGVLWSNHANETQVNAITTGLYSELSARLSKLENDESDSEKLLSSAISGFFWIMRALFDKDEYIVLDHLDIVSNKTFNWTFTYNTGQAIAVSIAIYNAMQGEHPDMTLNDTVREYLDLACNMANHAMDGSDWVDSNGTLTEPGAYPGNGPNKKTASQNDDAVGFKAILLRSLAKLYKVLLQDNLHPSLQKRLANFIKQQYQSLQDNDTNGKGQYGPWWDGPMDFPTSHSQLAALDVMAAIHAVGP